MAKSENKNDRMYMYNSHMFSLINKNTFYLYNDNVTKMIKYNVESEINLNMIFSLLNDFKTRKDISYYYPNHYNMYNLMFNVFSFAANKNSIIYKDKDVIINASAFIQEKRISLRSIIIDSMENDKIINYPNFAFDNNL